MTDQLATNDRHVTTTSSQGHRTAMDSVLSPVRTLLRKVHGKRHSRFSLLSVRNKLTAVILSIIAFNVVIDSLSILISWQSRIASNMLEVDQHVLADAIELQHLTHELHADSDDKASAERAKSLERLYAALHKSVREESVQFADRDDGNKLEEEISNRIGERIQEYLALMAARGAAGGSASPQAKELLAAIDEQIHQLIKEEARELKEVIDYKRNLRLLNEWVMATTIILSLLAAIAAITLLVKSIRTPLAELTEGALMFGAGNLMHRIDVRGNDEFASLASTMNRMAAELGEQKRSLEDESLRLQSAVETRTGELMQANLKLAETASYRQRFLAEIGHELRTPLTIIRGESEVVLRNSTATRDDYCLALRKIVEQTRHTTSLVSDLLFVASSEAGRAPIRDDIVELTSVVALVSEQMSVIAAERGIPLDWKATSNAPVRIQGDGRHLKRLMIILLENAIAYSPRGRGVETRVSSDGTTIRIEVVDQGHGIDPQEQSRVFERFYRGTQAASINPSGSGLGLPLAKAIAEAHLGTISLTSHPDHGTTVTVEFPELRNEAAA